MIIDIHETRITLILKHVAIHPMYIYVGTFSCKHIFPTEVCFGLNLFLHYVIFYLTIVSVQVSLYAFYFGILRHCYVKIYSFHSVLRITFKYASSFIF